MAIEEMEKKNIGVGHILQMLDAMEKRHLEDLTKLREYIKVVTSAPNRSYDEQILGELSRYLSDRNLTSQDMFQRWKEEQGINNRRICDILNSRLDVPVCSTSLQAYVERIYNNGGVG